INHTAIALKRLADRTASLKEMSIGSFLIGDDDAVQRHIKLEREKGIKLRKTPWWKTQIQSGVCHFCQQQVGAEALTMDHVVPLARGGK
ncbi:MAG: hypothetical protein KC643_11725, partial [Nitrospira sp.]|nr:hypothetical protein [Nitrospira sp.]